MTTTTTTTTTTPQVTETTQDKPRVRVVPFSEITEKPTEWLLPGVVPFSEITCFFGSPASGMSTFIHWLAARVSAKKKTLFRGQPIAQGKVLYYCDGNDYFRNIHPCLNENEAEISNILRISECSIEALKSINERRLMIIDLTTLISALGDQFNEHLVRRILGNYRDIAWETETAIVTLINTNDDVIPKIFPDFQIGLSPMIWNVSDTNNVSNVKNRLTEDRRGFSFKIAPIIRRVFITNDVV
jgi:hypothetical protein